MIEAALFAPLWAEIPRRDGDAVNVLLVTAVDGIPKQQRRRNQKNRQENKEKLSDRKIAAHSTGRPLENNS